MMAGLEMGGDVVVYLRESLLGGAGAIYIINNILRFALVPLETLRLC